MNLKVDIFLSKTKKFHDELEKLRHIILSCQLTEELKWRVPCYTFQGKNILLIGEFKEYCVLSFVKGALLNDSENILSKQGENSQSTRVIKFTTIQQILEIEQLLKTYIYEAIEIEKAGLKVDYKPISSYEYPDELQQKFDEFSVFKTAFEALTPGRQRAYILHFSGAKQSKTREDRIEKNMERILNGIGFHDCTCGLTKRKPNCDGSHKQLRK